MQPKIETIKVERVNIPKTSIQIELSPSEFWKLLDRLHLMVYESYEAFYMIPGRGEIVYFAKRREP